MVDLIAGIIDVFADVPLTGNPLAVVQGADDLSNETMRRIAGEFQQAETTSILRSTRADWKLRSFIASGAEVFGAGYKVHGSGSASTAISDGWRGLSAGLSILLDLNRMRQTLQCRSISNRTLRSAGAPLQRGRLANALRFLGTAA
ncbi:PhzF family phenazine biosynthesis protein [Rhizobium sp. PP-WC-2G-219]|nr:PhzF family phenazine biosynthesis protein [Rhizobium sp. PP-WC-2G-219]